MRIFILKIAKAITSGTMTPPHPSPSPEPTDQAAATSSTDSQVSSLSDKSTLEGHIQSLFTKFVPASSSDAQGERCVLCRDLPSLLDEYERQRGSRLVSDRLREELTQQVSQSPDVEISASTLLQLIGALQAAQPESDGEEGDSVALRRAAASAAAAASTATATSGSGGEDSSFSSQDDSSVSSSNEEEYEDDSFERIGEDDYQRSSSRDKKQSTPTVGGRRPLHLDDDGRPRAFPRSQSERAGLGQGAGVGTSTEEGDGQGQEQGQGQERDEEDQLTPGPSAWSSMRATPRKKTTSDPSDSPYTSRRVSAPASAPAGPSKRVKGDKRHERRKSIDPENREVLRGKGKLQAPPSAWSRPKPQALANREKERERERQRKLSDASSLGSPDHPQNSPLVDRDYDGHAALGLGRPPPHGGARQRLSSQPTMSVAREELAATPPSLPRSSSSSSTGFAFPRATSPPWGDSHEARANERWDALLDDIETPGASKLPASASAGSSYFESARSSSSRAASPGIDESSIGNFSSFGILAGAGTAGPQSPRRSSSRASGRRYRFDSDEADETMRQAHDDDLQSQLEALQRTLNERERAHNEVQEEHEAIISSLQNEIEVLKDQNAAMKREEKEASARETGQTDLINNLENDLSREQKLHEILKGQHNRLKVQLDDQKSEFGSAPNGVCHGIDDGPFLYPITDESKKLREAASADKQTMEKLEGAQVGFVSTNQRLADEISKKQARIEELQAKVTLLETQKAELEEMETTNAALREKIERLTAELEMRGTSEIINRGDFDQSSKATPSRTLGAEMQRLLDSAQAGEDDGGDEEGEASMDSMIETTVTRRRVRSSKSKRADGQAGNGEAESSGRIAEEHALPTYDEAALEKNIVTRLHPSCSAEDPASSRLVEGDGHRLVDGFVELFVGGQAMSPSYHYEMLKRTLGIRCQSLETRIEEHTKALHARVSTATAPTRRRSLSTIASSRLVRGVRPLASQAKDLVPGAVRSRVYNYVCAAKNSILPKDKAEESARRLLLLCSMLIFFVGLFLGVWWKPRTRLLLNDEDPFEWRLSNSLGLGLGGGYLDYRDAYVDEGFFAWIASQFLRLRSSSLDVRPRLVPT